MRNYGSLDLTKETVENNNQVEVKVGAYPAKILRVADNFEKEYLTLWFDLQDQRFAKASNNNLENWDSKGKITVWYNQKARETKSFDAFITCITNSNEGFVWKWNEQELVNKKMVVVYGEEEWYDKENTIRVSVRPRMIRSIQAFQKGEIKPLALRKAKAKENNNTTYNPGNSYQQGGYIPNSSKEMNQPTIPQMFNVDVSDEDLPF